MTAIQDARQAAPHLFLSFAFRPFFLAAGLFAALVMVAWLPMVVTGLELPIAITPRDWHVHEMLYGYATAAIAGFLFTAIPNWTGRPPVSGALLLALLLVWVGGRLAMATSALIGLPLAVLVDLLFLPFVAMIAGREIVAAGNRRNFKLLGVLALLAAGNVVFHVETISEGLADYGQRLGLATLIGLIILIGGRIVPSFTRNALMRAKPGRLPEPFGRFDVAAVAVSIAALALWVALPQSAVTGTIALAAAVVQAIRLARWAGDRARGDWLVLVLHVAYGFVALGFLLAGMAALAPQVPTTGAAHAWGAGAIGLMTLAVMTRATLGHSGRRLAASRGTIVVYQLAIVAALARLGAILPSSFDTLLLELAAAAWIAAFAGFVAIYGPMMMRPSLTAGRAG